MSQTACPQRPRMKALVERQLPEAEQRRLAAHLDQCPECQERAEELTDIEHGWTPADATPTSTALRRLMDEMKHKTMVTARPTMSTTIDDRLLLGFLQPAGERACLGLLDGYEVTKVLGRGGMGIVLEAWDPSLERYVAIKVLAPQLAASDTARERFAREARAAAAVNHEHVVAIHAVDDVNGLPYLVMERVPGRSLQEWLDREGPLEVRDILRVGTAIASGLAAAHAQGLVHRDIKPANILLSPKSKVQGKKGTVPLRKGDCPLFSLDLELYDVKISDFGLARAADDASLTQSGMLAGTPHYMAPEQARGEAVDARADLFSLGSVLYAMCTGQPPFPSGSTLAVLRQVSETTPPLPSRLNRAIPRWLDHLIARLHALDPADRFTSAAEVADLLERCLAHVQQPDRVALPAGVMSSPRKRNRARWVLPVVLLVGCAGTWATAKEEGWLATRPAADASAATRHAAAGELMPPNHPERNLPEALSWTTIDREQGVQISGRKVQVPDPRGKAFTCKSALELNLRLAGQTTAHILIFGLPGISGRPGPTLCIPDSPPCPAAALVPPCPTPLSKNNTDQVGLDSKTDSVWFVVLGPRSYAFTAYTHRTAPTRPVPPVVSSSSVSRPVRCS